MLTNAHVVKAKRHTLGKILEEEKEKINFGSFGCAAVSGRQPKKIIQKWYSIVYLILKLEIASSHLELIFLAAILSRSFCKHLQKN